MKCNIGLFIIGTLLNMFICFTLCVWLNDNTEKRLRSLQLIVRAQMTTDSIQDTRLELHTHDSEGRMK